MELDWGDGDYALIAAALAPTAEVLVDAAEVAAGQEVADIACGTGNVALAAAARGAAATGVDGSAPLVEQARRRAAAAGLAARFLQGDAGSLPLLDGAFDAAVSAFGVIFAPDPARALAEMVRVTRPGGVVALTSWASEGPICEAGGALRDALPAGGGGGPAPATSAPGPRGSPSRPSRRAPGWTSRWRATRPGAGAGVSSAPRPGSRCGRGCSPRSRAATRTRPPSWPRASTW